jgi:hypothetical protein
MSTTIAPVPGSDMPILVRFTTSYRELVAALRAINRAVPLMRRIRRLSWAAIVITALLIAANVITVWSASAVLFVPALMLFLAWVMPFQLAWMTRRRSPYWTGEQYFEFTAAGIRVGTSASESFLAWDAIMRTAEGRRFFLFFSSDQAGHFVPKRVLLPVQEAQLHELFESRASKAGAGAPSYALANAPVVVEARFEYESAEAARAGMVAARKAGGLWISYAVISALVLWNTVAPAYAQWQRGGWRAISLPLLVLGMAPWLIIVLALPLASRWAARRALRTGPSTRGTQRVGVAEWGLRVTGPLHSGELKWPAFMRAVETEEFFLFFISKVQPIFVPKRLLTAAELEQVRALTRDGLGAKAAVYGGALK